MKQLVIAWKDNGKTRTYESPMRRNTNIVPNPAYLASQLNQIEGVSNAKSGGFSVQIEFGHLYDANALQPRVSHEIATSIDWGRYHGVRIQSFDEWFRFHIVIPFLLIVTVLLIFALALIPPGP